MVNIDGVTINVRNDNYSFRLIAATFPTVFEEDLLECYASLLRECEAILRLNFVLVV